MIKKSEDSDNNYQSLIEELRKTQMLLKASLESPKNIIILSINKNYQYLFFNNSHKNSMKKAYGVDVSIGMNILDSIPDVTDQQRLKKCYDRSLAGEAHSSIEEYGDTVRVYFESFFNPLLDENGEIIGVTVFAQDISERKRAENALVDSKEWQQQIIENSDAGYFLLDLKGMFQQVNPAWLRMHKYENIQEVIGKHFSITQVDADFASAQTTVEKLLEGNKFISGEFSRLCKDGSIEWHTFFAHSIEKRGVISGLECFIIDTTERRKAEDELKKNSARHAVMMANIGDVIGIMGADSIMVYKSPNIERWFGWKPEDVVGKEYWDTVHPDDHEWLKKVFEKLLKKYDASTTIEYRYKCKNDSYTWVELTAVNRLNIPEIDGVLLNYHDISERKNAEKRLMRSERNYRGLFTNMITACALHEIVIDENGNPIDYIFLETNEAFENMTGLSRVAIAGKRVTEVLPGIENDPGDWIGTYGEVALSGVPFGFEQYLELLNKWFSVLAYSPVKGQFVTIFFDISDRKNVEQTISDEKERLAVTLRSIGDGVITTNTKGNIEMLNRVAEELTGWNADEARGRPLSEVFNIINEITGEQCENPVKKVLTTGNIVELANNTSLITRSGRQIIIADSGAPIRDKENHIIGVVLVFRDMTEKQRLNESMQKMQKLESLGVLAGGIAHDFNNLLSGIFGYLDMANESVFTGNQKDVSKYLTKASGVYERARALTQQLLTFSKGGAPIRKTMQLAPFIEKNVIFALSGSNVAYEIDIADDLWLCDCDENQIGQVIDNIIINAKQAMAMGGKIIVLGQNVSIEQGQSSVPSKCGNFVKISIQDFGIGMPKEILTRIYDPFFSTKETGHGLGLATVFSIVQRHDGWIDMESELGKGSTFHIFIAASKNDSIVPSSPKQVEHKGSGTILVLDDEEYIRETLTLLLLSMGYSSICVKEGDEALDCIRADKKGFQQITGMIFDLTIPGGKGGKEIIAEVHKELPLIPVFVASGYAEDPIMAHPSEYGFVESLCKPFRKAELAQILSRHLKSVQ